ncbi:MAG TPA: glutamate racemase, partial [Bacteroidia bacterium]|nr:glutamate racemase [Bacteroidia bacterium]
LYFGDTAHLPYGDKSAQAVENYSIRIAEFLISQHCKMIVIACNTASSFGNDAVKKLTGKHIPVINVIDPVVEMVAKKFQRGSIGVIGTKGTIRSDVYAKKIAKQNRKLHVHSQATPLLAPMVEEGFFDNKISRTIINSYLTRPKLRDIDSLILACTHYPLIRKEIEEFYDGKVLVIDSAETVAQHVKKKLASLHMLATRQKKKNIFYVSDYTASFEKSTRIFFKGKIQLKHFPLWEK